MRNERLRALDVLLGDWDVTLSGAWFLDSLETEQYGTATFAWLDDAFVVMTSVMEGEPTWDFAFGHRDATGTFHALYHDQRGVGRLFDMTFGDGRWTLTRADPDFHQRWLATVADHRIVGRWEASEDAGSTWRKDFDLVFERRSA
ncbi:MAG TPA: hypothetical protein VK875_13825 [Euzebyales bacterium]|nr:hypothetical protein [Euzebyales bacterium]